VITTPPVSFLAIKADVPSWLTVVRVLSPTIVMRVAPVLKATFSSMRSWLTSIREGSGPRYPGTLAVYRE
jgi:hypothetical protein